MPEEDKIEPAEYDAYVEADHGELTDKDKIDFFKVRYQSILSEYKVLKLQRLECKFTEREEILTQIRKAFESNYRARKYVVKELRLLGERVTDPYVPG